LTTITPTPIASGTFQTWAVAIFSFLTIGLGGLGALLFVLSQPSTFLAKVIAVITFAILVLGAVLSTIVKILPTGWQGRAKVGISLVAVVLVAVLPFVKGNFNPVTDIPLLGIALVNAITTQLGVAIRVTPALDATGNAV